MARKTDQEEGMNAIERGRFRYKQKDYDGALEAFNEVRTTYELFAKRSGSRKIHEVTSRDENVKIDLCSSLSYKCLLAP